MRPGPGGPRGSVSTVCGAGGLVRSAASDCGPAAPIERTALEHSGVVDMPTSFRIIASAGGPISHADTIDDVLAFAKGSPPGRYRIDKIWLDRDTGDLRCWVWGEVIKAADGLIKLDLPPWLDGGRPVGPRARMARRPHGFDGNHVRIEGN
jgi:hypothetical protein